MKNDVVLFVDQFIKTEVHAPTLNDNLQPSFELRTPSKCPIYDIKNGKCDECEFFVGIDIPDGVVFSYMSFEALCDCISQRFQI